MLLWMKKKVDFANVSQEVLEAFDEIQKAPRVRQTV